MVMSVWETLTHGNYSQSPCNSWLSVCVCLCVLVRWCLCACALPESFSVESYTTWLTFKVAMSNLSLFSRWSALLEATGSQLQTETTTKASNQRCSETIEHQSQSECHVYTLFCIYHPRFWGLKDKFTQMWTLSHYAPSTHGKTGVD